MNKLRLAVSFGALLLWWFFTTACSAPGVRVTANAAPSVCAGDSFTGEVVGVSDGDTINVLRDGRAVRVRLHGVDAPEKAQAFGQKAKQFTSDLVFRKTVTVCITDTDRYGRTVGTVGLSDGRVLNHELLRAGLAWHYRRYSRDASLQQLEDEARAARRGLWVDDKPTPPWEWRQERRNSR